MSNIGTESDDFESIHTLDNNTVIMALEDQPTFKQVFDKSESNENDLSLEPLNLPFLVKQKRYNDNSNKTKVYSKSKQTFKSRQKDDSPAKNRPLNRNTFASQKTTKATVLGKKIMRCDSDLSMKMIYKGGNLSKILRKDSIFDKIAQSKKREKPVDQFEEAKQKDPNVWKNVIENYEKTGQAKLANFGFENTPYYKKYILKPIIDKVKNNMKYGMVCNKDKANQNSLSSTNPLNRNSLNLNGNTQQNQSNINSTNSSDLNSDVLKIDDNKQRKSKFSYMDFSSPNPRCRKLDPNSLKNSPHKKEELKSGAKHSIIKNAFFPTNTDQSDTPKRSSILQLSNADQSPTQGCSSRRSTNQQLSNANNNSTPNLSSGNYLGVLGVSERLFSRNHLGEPERKSKGIKDLIGNLTRKIAHDFYVPESDGKNQYKTEDVEDLTKNVSLISNARKKYGDSMLIPGHFQPDLRKIRENKRFKSPYRVYKQISNLIGKGHGFDENKPRTWWDDKRYLTNHSVIIYSNSSMCDVDKGTSSNNTSTFKL